MHQESELRRLAGVRPAILDRTEEVVSLAEQERILRLILDEPRRHGRRIAVRTSVAAASVAAASVAAALLVGVAFAVHGDRLAGTGGRPPGVVVRLDAKTVLTKSIRALSDLGDAVEYSHLTGSLNGQKYFSDLWVYRAAEKQRLSGPGRADTQAWQFIRGGALTKGYIDYDRKTWSQYADPADPTWRAISRTPTARLEARFLTAILTSGRWTVTGKVVIDGQEALVVRLTETFPGGRGPEPGAGRRSRAGRIPAVVPAGPLMDVAPTISPAQYARAQARGQTTFTSTGTVITTLYISARTYLPIMETDVTHLTSQGVPHSAADQTQSSTFRWLPVTRTSLALLQPPMIPAGYTRVLPAGQ